MWWFKLVTLTIFSPFKNCIKLLSPKNNSNTENKTKKGPQSYYVFKKLLFEAVDSLSGINWQITTSCILTWKVWIFWVFWHKNY